MSYLINELGLSGRLQYFHINTKARDFDREQAAVIRLRHVSRDLDLPTEMTVLTALAPTNVAAFGGTTLKGEQWMVAIDRAPASVGDLLDYFDDRGERLHTQRDTSAKILLTDEQLRAIYADAGAGPDAEQIGFTSLLIGLQAEAFGYPLGDVVNNMNAQCAFPDDANHDCEGSFFGDIGAGWVNRGPNGYAADDSADDEVPGDDESTDITVDEDRHDKITLENPDGSIWTYVPYHGDQYSPGETGWILTITGSIYLDPQPVSLTGVLGDIATWGLTDTTAPQLAIVLTEAMAESLRNGHVADRRYPSEPYAAERLAQIEAELAQATSSDRNAEAVDDDAPSPGGVPAPLMRPTEGQTKEEFADDFIEAFKKRFGDVNNPDQSPAAVEQRARDDAFGRWRHEQNVWRAEQDKADNDGDTDQGDVEDGRGAP